MMSSGTRAVSVILVGITHHGWQGKELQKSHALTVVILSEARNLGSFSQTDSAFDKNTLQSDPNPQHCAWIRCSDLGIWCFSISAMAHVKIETIKNGPY